MGWLISHDLTKAEQVAELAQGWSNKNGTGSRCVGHSVRGNVFYGVFEPTIDGKPHNSPESRWISICLLRKDRNAGWGYKNMSESMHPYNYDCPLKFLKMAPTVASQDWRDNVEAHHARKRAQASPLQPGDTFTFRDGLTWVNISLDGDEGIILEKVGRGYIAKVGGAVMKVYRRHMQPQE